MAQGIFAFFYHCQLRSMIFLKSLFLNFTCFPLVLLLHLNKKTLESDHYKLLLLLHLEHHHFSQRFY